MAEPPLKRQRLDMTKTFAVIVGHSKTKFILHTELATRSSKFFEAAMTKDWAESQEKEVKLAEHDDNTFGSYLQWLNTGQEVTLDDSAFRNAVLDYVVDFFCQDKLIPGPLAISLAWERTPQDSSLRKLWLHMWAIQPLAMQVEFLKKRQDDFPKDFIIEMFQHTITYKFKEGKLTKEERNSAVKEYRRKIAEQQTEDAGR